MTSSIPEPWESRWRVEAELGEGGQGKTYRVVTAARADEREASVRQIVKSIEFVIPRARNESDGPKILDAARLLATSVDNLNRLDRPPETGALKVLKIPNGELGTQARERFRGEIEALRKLDEVPAILRLLDANAEAGWMVTELHSNGTLEENLHLFKGDALGALRALRPLAAAIAEIHKLGMVHRDIKPSNLFIDNTGRGLILGDFGIVFWANEKMNRLTETFERVGSRDWMAPWAHTGRRIEEVNPSFDVFSLGKLLWSMLSGQPFLPFWYWQKPEYNLENLFPRDEGTTSPRLQ